jgi:hypothetical protein
MKTANESWWHKNLKTYNGENSRKAKANQAKA